MIIKCPYCGTQHHFKSKSEYPSNCPACGGTLDLWSIKEKIFKEENDDIADSKSTSVNFKYVIIAILLMFTLITSGFIVIFRLINTSINTIKGIEDVNYVYSDDYDEFAWIKDGVAEGNLKVLYKTSNNTYRILTDIHEILDKYSYDSDEFDKIMFMGLDYSNNWFYTYEVKADFVQILHTDKGDRYLYCFNGNFEDASKRLWYEYREDGWYVQDTNSTDGFRKATDDDLTGFEWHIEQ